MINANFEIDAVLAACVILAKPPETVARSMNNRELLMPRYFFDIKNGHRLVDSSGLDCLDDADAISRGETMARQIEADGSIGTDPQRHVAVMNEEGQQIGKIAVRRAPAA